MSVHVNASPVIKVNLFRSVPSCMASFASYFTPARKFKITCMIIPGAANVITVCKTCGISDSRFKLAKKKQLHKHAAIAVHFLTMTCAAIHCERRLATTADAIYNPPQMSKVLNL